MANSFVYFLCEIKINVICRICLHEKATVPIFEDPFEYFDSYRLTTAGRIESCCNVIVSLK